MIQNSCKNKNNTIFHEQIHFDFISSELILDKHWPGCNWHKGQRSPARCELTPTNLLIPRKSGHHFRNAVFKCIYVKNIYMENK